MEKIELLEKWIIENDGYINNKINIELSKEEKIIIKANDIINRNEILIKIPEKIRINKNIFEQIPNIDEWIKYSEINIKLKDFLNNNINKIIISLIYHKTIGSKSFYYPYISTLPLIKEFKNLGIFHANEENLKTWKSISINFSNMIEHQLEFINNLYNNILILNNHYNLININRIIYDENKKVDILYYLIVWSYIIYNTKYWNNIGLIPLIDLFEHNYNSKILVKLNNEDINNIHLINESEYILKDDILTLNYGIYDSIKILANYGKIQINDIIYMNINANIDILENENREFIEKERKKLNNKFYLTSLYPEVKLFYYLRISSLNSYEINNIIKNNKEYYKSRITIENELKTLKLMLNIMEKLKLEYNNERKNLCIDLLEKTDNEITKNLIKIILYNYDIIQNNIFWIHKEWLNCLNSSYIINKNLMIKENKIELLNTNI